MQHVESFIESIGAIACFLLMIAVCFGVVERYVLKITIIEGLYNITESIIFPTLVFTALAGSYRSGLWPRLDVIIDRLAIRKYRIISSIHDVMGLVIYLTVTYFTILYAVKLTIDGRTFQAGVHNLPIWPILWLVPVAFALLSIEVLLNLWKLNAKVKE